MSDTLSDAPAESAPVPTAYVHNKCGTTTIMSRAMAEIYAREPHIHKDVFCMKCGAYVPASECRWADSNQVVGSMMPKGHPSDDSERPGETHPPSIS